MLVVIEKAFGHVKLLVLLQLLYYFC